MAVKNNDIIAGQFSRLLSNGLISENAKKALTANPTLILSDDFAPIKNAIFADLMNRIGKTKISEMLYKNPLSMFKSGSLPFGDTIQEVSTNVVEGSDYKTEADQFAIKKNEVKASYTRINRQRLYKTTIYDTQLDKAFTDAYGLDALISSLVKSLADSNEIEEYKFTKELIEGFFSNAKLRDEQKIVVPQISGINGVASKDDILSFVRQVKLTAEDMKFPSDKYTVSAKATQSMSSDLVLIVPSQAKVDNETHNLASTLNPDYLDYKIKLLSVGEFEDKKLQGVLCDKRAFSVVNKLEKITQAINSEALYRNVILHSHQLYGVSPFYPLVYLYSK